MSVSDTLKNADSLKNSVGSQPPMQAWQENRTPKVDRYPRFDALQRIEHGLLLVSFTILAITGLPQMYAQTAIGSGAIGLMGGIEVVRIIHRVSAFVLMFETIYHVIAVAYKVLVLRVPMTMMPGWKDIKDAVQTLGFNLGIAKNPPQMGRYTFGEKVEYWAVIWGTVIMILTGFILWNPIATAQVLPGSWIPAAKAAHGGEALLAVLSIVTWHLYNVHVKHFNKSMFTGRISRHEMEEEHPLELAQVEAGHVYTPPAPDVLRRRQVFFLPVAVIASLVLLIGLVFFVTFEKTAITTIPQQNVESVSPAQSP